MDNKLQSRYKQLQTSVLLQLNISIGASFPVSIDGRLDHLELVGSDDCSSHDPDDPPQVEAGLL
jgi:hypothetical protein